MKNIVMNLAAIVAASLLCASCTTARHVAVGATDVAAGAVEKTGHVVEHGTEKVANNL